MALNTTLSTNDNFTDINEEKHVPQGFQVDSDLPLLGLALLIVIANGTIVGLFVRKRSLRSFTNYFLVSLAISDILTGLLTIPLFISCNATEREDICAASSQFFVFTTLSTISHIASITADRYIAIMKSLRYQELVTKKRVQLATTLIWLCSLFLALVQLAWSRPGEKDPNDLLTEDYKKKDIVYTIVIIVLGVTPIPFMVLAYVRIFVVILRQNSIAREQSRLGGTGERPSTREFRTVVMFVLMLLAYTFCLVPNAALRVQMNIDEAPLDFFPVPVIQAIIYLCFLTSFLNPCFYGFGKHDFRCVLIELFFRKCSAQNGHVRKNKNMLYSRATACESIM